MTEERLGWNGVDPVFKHEAKRGLVWLPEAGMGYYPVTEAPYDAAYFARYERMADTDMGRHLTKLRVDLVSEFYAPDGLVLDVGIGSGQFIEARPDRKTYGYDINPVAVEWLDARDLFLDPRATRVPVATMWDVLEHIHNPAALLASVDRLLFVSLPIFTGPDHVLRSHHFRRDEHCWYWTRDGFLTWMNCHGFECVEHNTAESLAGRADVHTFVMKRHNPTGGD